MNLSVDNYKFEAISIKDGDYLLDLGCGEGRHAITAYCHYNISSIGVDLCFRDLVTASNRFKVLIKIIKTKTFLLLIVMVSHSHLVIIVLI